MNRTRKEWLKEQLEKLDTIEHEQILNIVLKFTENITRTPTGVFVSCENLSIECLTDIEKYILFCLDQRKRFENDNQNLKIYKRLVTRE
jgi:hypothetical protein